MKSKFFKRASGILLTLALVFTLSLSAFASGSSTITYEDTEIELKAAASMVYSLGARQSNGEYPTNTLLYAFEHTNFGGLYYRVNVSYDSSGNLLNAMRAEQAAGSITTDVFLSAALAQMTTATNEEIIDSSYDLLNNRLVLVARTDSNVSFSGGYAGVAAWLAGATWVNGVPNRTFAVGDPDIVPAGNYTKTVFDRIDVVNGVASGTTWDYITTNYCPNGLYSNVTNVLNAVVAGTETVGSVYSTDAATRTDLVELDNKNVDIIYPVGITTAAAADATRNTGASALVEFFFTDLAKSAAPAYDANETVLYNNRDSYLTYYLSTGNYSFFLTYGFSAA